MEAVEASAKPCAVWPRRRRKPLIAVLMAEDQDRRVISVEGPHGLPGRGSVPIFHEVEPAVRALATLVAYSRWLDTPADRFRNCRRSQPRKHAR